MAGTGCRIRSDGEGQVTLTLTLSLRERGQIEHGLTFLPLPQIEHGPAFPPLPQGESRGEGPVFSLSLRERAGVRVKKAS